MDNEYLSYLKEDAKLYAVVKDKLPELQRLSSAQIEKLVFYMKSLHGYYPKSENHVAFHSEFSDKLEKLRSSSEQVALQRQAGAAALKGIACCVFAGVLLAIALAALFGGHIGVGVGSLVAVGTCILFADSRLLRKALLLNKEQDRKYFLSSIRAANACNELDWAGLFSYNQASKIGPHSDADLARLEAEIGDLTGRLRAALYNDEYFQYSSAELKANETSPSTTLADEGFLSDETVAVVTTIRAKYVSWSSELRSLNGLLVRAQYGLTIHVQSAREVVCAALYVRALVHGQATVLLIERGMAASARAMARCAMEALFNLGACAREPAKALAFLDADEVDKLRKAKYLATVKDPTARETVAESNLDQILADTQRRISELDARELKTRDMAKAAGLEDLYLTGYAFLCGAVHSSARDIDQHFEVDADGNPRALVNEPIIDGLDKLCLMVGEIMVATNRALAEVFEVPTIACEKSLERLHTLWQQSAG